ncbi:hypothetical protein [Paenibacillus anseongense]|uniref:hypothetical protein n=1 Tax=Paenibacillus anseongense TaxID=2682845 RepID=UPI002DB989CE|nr:hypothetical protein [Paenibacillus anseongense]MEC0270523.1 hypothetical protein [Paenibacillus anseongense]
MKQLQQLHSEKQMPKDLMKPVIIAVETEDEEALLKATGDFFARLRSIDFASIVYFCICFKYPMSVSDT